MKAYTPAVKNMMFDILFIDPITNIIKGLENNKYRDVDIVYLDGKLAEYTKMACDAIKFPFIDPGDKYSPEPYLNEYVKCEYLEQFGTLLSFFMSAK